MKKSKRHYVLTDETIEFQGHILHRIKCIEEFVRNYYYTIKVGQLGGFVESYDNLQDNSWVDDEAKVFGNSIVKGDSIIRGHACVYGNAKITDAKISEWATVCGNAQIIEGYVHGHACVYGNTQIGGEVYGCVQVYGSADIGINTKIYGSCHICGNVRIGEYTEIFGMAKIDFPTSDVILPFRIKGDLYLKNTKEFLNYYKTERKNYLKEYEELKSYLNR
jgi:carbonic anhydrase/acetyltransferase-like protein (isoleucine patch superfamily)